MLGVGQFKAQKRMTCVEDIFSQFGWDPDQNSVKVELVNGIHEEVNVKPWIALEDFSHLDVNDFEDGNECVICNKYLSSRSKLARHIKEVHDKIKDYKCDKCSYACSQKNSLNLHMKAIHEGIKATKDFKCDQCEYAASRNYYLSVHIKTRHGNDTSNNRGHKCEQCGKMFSTKQKMQLHIKCIHDKIKDHKCDLCDHASASKFNLDIHIKGVHGDGKINFKCDKCPYQHAFKKKLQKHKKRYHSKHARKYLKDIMSSQDITSVSKGTSTDNSVIGDPLSDNPEEVNDALKQGMEKQKSNYLCDLCNYKSPKRSLVVKHTKSVHDRVKDFKCDQCAYATSSKWNLTLHNKAGHIKGDERMSKRKEISQMLIEGIDVNDAATKLNCSKQLVYKVREQTFKSKLIQETPKQKRSTCKPSTKKVLKYSCAHCEYKSNNEHFMARHKKAVHDKIKDFKCKECSMSFAFRGSLNAHVRVVHDRIKDFKCDLCEYTASVISKLNHHQKVVHEKVKNFKCDQCDYAASKRSNLSEHIKRVHEKIREYRCNHCPYECFSEKILDNHVRSKHENGPNPTKRTLKKLELSNMLEEGVEMEVIAAKLNCSKQLINKMCGPTYKSGLFQETTKQKESVLTKKVSRNRELKYSCDICHYKSTNETSMARHKRVVHDNIKDYNCDKCGMSFALRGSLNKHIQIVHEKIKEFKCELCEYMCDSRSKLQYHLKEVHDKVKNFKCDQCEYATSRNFNLSAHVKEVHLKADYKCKECDFASPSRYLVAKHMKESHKLSSGMEVWVTKEPTNQVESEAEHIDDTDDPLNINLSKIKSQSNINPEDSITFPWESTFSKEQIHKALQINGNSAHWVRKKAALSIAHCGRLSLQDLTSIQFQSVSIVDQGVEIKNVQHLAGSQDILVPFNHNKSEPCPASLVIMYLNCLKRAPRALGPGDTLFSQARHEELCNLGQEVASLIGLEHPELYKGHCFSTREEDGVKDVAEEDFMAEETLMAEDTLKVEPV